MSKPKRRDKIIPATLNALFAALVIFYLYFGISSLVLFTDLDRIVDNTLLVEILIVTTSLAASYYFFIKILNYFHQKYGIVKWWNSKIALTIGLMILFYSVGHVSLAYVFGAPDKISLVLRNSQNIGEILGNITCKDNSGKLLAGNEITCEIKPYLSNISANVTFDMYNGSVVTNNFSDRRFIAPQNSHYIYFQIMGIDKHYKSLEMEVGSSMKFLTKEQSDKRDEQYITYFILLLGVVLFSVPTMMNNFKNLTEK